METFVVRVWLPARGVTDARAGALRGLVEHVRTAESSSFTTDDELLQFLREAVASSERPAVMSSSSSRLAEGRTP
jgi:hypothetical protein